MTTEIEKLREWIGNDQGRALTSIALDLRAMRLHLTKAKATKAQAKDPEYTEAERAATDMVIGYLNAVAGKKYKPVGENLRLIANLLRAGYDAADFRRAIDSTTSRWAGDPKMERYLRPATLFGPENFASKYAGDDAEEAWA